MPLWVLLIFLHVLAIMWGIHLGANDKPTLAGVLFSLTAAITVVKLCVIDARARRTPIVPIVQFLMLPSWTIAAPIYLIWSRRWYGVLWALLWAFTFGVCYLVPAIIVAGIRINSI